MSVENNEVTVEDVDGVGSIVLGIAAVRDLDGFEVTDGVEGRVSVKSAIVRILSFDVEMGKETVEGIRHGKVRCERFPVDGAVRVDSGRRIVVDTDVCNGVQSDERTVVVSPVVVGAFEQDTLREEVAYLQVGARRCVQVSQKDFVLGLKVVGFHACRVVGRLFR